MMALIKKMPRNTLDKIDISIQCPLNQSNEVREFFDKLDIPCVIKHFFDNFIEKLNQTDILITRAGAGTINDVDKLTLIFNI